MDVVERVRQAVFQASVPHNDMFGESRRSVGYYTSAGIDYFWHPHERLAELQDKAARAAIAALFDWLAEPSGAAVDAGAYGSGEDSRGVALGAWQAMLAEMRKEALGE